MNDRDYLCTNTVDPAFDFDEFKDIDNEYEGLTIVSMGKDTRRWLKGYNIL
jgi:predicted cupin superfamily sugar epimerase